MRGSVFPSFTLSPFARNKGSYAPLLKSPKSSKILGSIGASSENCLLGLSDSCVWNIFNVALWTLQSAPTEHYVASTPLDLSCLLSSCIVTSLDFARKNWFSKQANGGDRMHSSSDGGGLEGIIWGKMPFRTFVKAVTTGKTTPNRYLRTQYGWLPFPVARVFYRYGRRGDVRPFLPSSSFTPR